MVNMEWFVRWPSWKSPVEKFKRTMTHYTQYSLIKKMCRNSLDVDLWRSSFCKTLTLALIELKRSWSGSFSVDWLLVADVWVVVAFWYGDRGCRFGEFILISALPPLFSCTGEYSLNDNKSSAFMFHVMCKDLFV